MALASAFAWQSSGQQLHGRAKQVATLECDESFGSFDEEQEEVVLTAESNLTELSFCGQASQPTLQTAGRPSKSCGGVDELLLEQQDASPCPSSYLGAGSQTSTGITPVHRATVVDNIIAAAARLGLNNDSLFTAVAVLDRYLAVKPVLLPLLQPTAIACLWVASKYEQLVVPPVLHFATLLHGGDQSLASNSVHLSKQLLVELEAEILAALDFRLAAIVTVKSFKGWLMQQLHCSKAAAAMSRRQLDQMYCMTSYLTEVSLLEYRLLPFKPSQVASAAFVYAHVLLGLQVGTALQLTNSTLPELTALLEVFCALHSTLSAALHLGRPYNVTAKYRNPAVCGVANIPPMTIPAEQRVGGW